VKYKKFFLSFFLFLFFTPLLYPVFGQQTMHQKKIAVQEDAFVDSAFPDSNFGDFPFLETSFAESSKIIFIKPAELPEINSKEKIFLSLQLQSSTNSQEFSPEKNQPVFTELLLPDQDWKEKNLNWNNKPSLYSSGLKAKLEATPGACLIDISPIARKWQKKEVENNGFAIYHNGVTFQRTYSSKEDKDNPASFVLETENEIAPSTKPSPLPETETKQQKRSTVAEKEKPEIKKSQVKGQTTASVSAFQSFVNHNLIGISLWSLASLTALIRKNLRLTASD